MVSDGVLKGQWDSSLRPLRNLLAMLLTILVFAVVPFALLINALAGGGLEGIGGRLGANAGLVLVTGLWTLIVLTLFGGHLRAAYRDYKRHS